MAMNSNAVSTPILITRNSVNQESGDDANMNAHPVTALIAKTSGNSVFGGTLSPILPRIGAAIMFTTETMVTIRLKNSKLAPSPIKPSASKLWYHKVKKFVERPVTSFYMLIANNRKRYFGSDRHSAQNAFNYSIRLT